MRVLFPTWREEEEEEEEEKKVEEEEKEEEDISTAMVTYTILIINFDNIPCWITDLRDSR